MKTGGTMNFLKRAGAILMLVAIFASSCNKYADDFKQLNTKLDALANQVTGVPTLSADITALKASVASLATAIAALPTTSSITALSTSLGDLSKKIDGIATALNNLATAAATKTDVAKVVSDIKAELTLQLGVTNKAISDAQAKILAASDQQTKDIQKSIVDNNTTLAALIQAQINVLGTSLNGTLGQQQAAIDAMVVMLKAQQSQLAQILMNTSTLASNVTIKSDAELNYWKKYLTVPSMINGTVTVDVTSISSTMQARLDSVLANVVSVFGGTTPQVNVKSNSTLKVNLPNLTSVVGDMTSVGVITIPQLTSVSGALSMNADGPYSLSNALTVKDLTLTVYTPSASGVTPVVIGTTGVTLPNLTITGVLNGGGSVSFADALSVDLEGACTSLTVDKATTVNLHGAKHTGAFQLSAAVATSVTDAATNCAGALTIAAAKAGTVNMPNITTVGTGNAVSITTTVVSNVTLPKLVTGGNVTIDMGSANNGTIDLTAFKSNASVTIVGPKTVSLAAYVSGQLTAAQATTVTLASHDGVLAPSCSAVTNLTMGALNTSGFALGTYTALISADITGKANTADFTSVGNTKMTTLKVTGPLAGASVTGADILTSLTTAGVVNSMTVKTCKALVATNFAHTPIIGGNGSVLDVETNIALTTLQLVDYPQSITITGNGALKTLDVSKLVTPLYPYAPALTTIVISGNAFTGNYVASKAGTPTTPASPTQINSALLTSLQAFVAKYPAPGALVYPKIALAINIDKVTQTGDTTTPTLQARMQADFVANALNVVVTDGGLGTSNTLGISTQAQMLLVQ